jgi:hypothetical protein
MARRATASATISLSPEGPAGCAPPSSGSDPLGGAFDGREEVALEMLVREAMPAGLKMPATGAGCPAQFVLQVVLRRASASVQLQPWSFMRPSGRTIPASMALPAAFATSAP